MKKIELSTEIKTKIVELYKTNNSIKRTQEQLKDELGVDLSYPKVRRTIQEILDESGQIKEKIKELNEQISDKNKYDIEGGDYVFYRKKTDQYGEEYKERIAIPISLVDDLFKSYSRYGDNLTQQEIIDRFEIKPEVWNLLKNRLGLNKLSHVISPYTLENSDPEELEERIIDASYEFVDNKKRKFVDTVDKVRKNQQKKLLRFCAKTEETLEEFDEYLKGHTPKKIKFKKSNKKYKNNSIDIGFSDTHLGSSDTDEIVRRMGEIKDYAISREERIVNIMFLGDLAECLVEGGMHSGQTKEMIQQETFELMEFIADVFEEMLIEIYKAGKDVTFIGLPGNHDRLGKDNKEDQRRNGAHIIFRMIKRGLKNINIKLNFLYEKINSVDTGNFNYILSHKNRFGSDKNRVGMGDSLWKFGKQGKGNIIMHGHEHNINIGETKDCTKIGLPAIKKKDQYAKDLGYFSEPGFVVIEKSSSGLADVLVKRLS